MQRMSLHCRSALRLVAALALALLATFTTAQEHGEFVDGAALDALFVELRAAPDEAAARRIDRRIWMVWTTPNDPILAGRMQEVFTARRMGDTIEAIKLLNRIVVDYPDYAEGWNQRATMYYMVGNASIEDCEKSLSRAPPFGALSGRALMYLQRGRRVLPRDMATARNPPFPLSGRFRSSSRSPASDGAHRSPALPTAGGWHDRRCAAQLG